MLNGLPFTLAKLHYQFVSRSRNTSKKRNAPPGFKPATSGFWGQQISHTNITANFVPKNDLLFMDAAGMA